MHMKRYTMPGFWPIGRKVNKFVVTPRPGPHSKQSSIPLMIFLRDVLGYADTSREVKRIIAKGEVMVDKRVIREAGHPLGLMDVIEFPLIKKHFRVMPHPKGLEIVEIDGSESSKKLCSIKRKTVIKGGKYQITLHDGRNIIVGKDNKYKPGDSVLIEIPTQKILNHWQIKEGLPATVVKGKNIGLAGKIKSVHQSKRLQEKSRVVLETKGGDIETLRDYILVGEVK